MIIYKNGQAHTVTELAQEWKVERQIGEVHVVYKVSKEIAPSVESIEQYIMEGNGVF